MHKKLIILITGLSSAGKTTLGENLNKYFHDKKLNVSLLDGENIRKKLDKKFGHTLKERIVVFQKIIELAKKEQSLFDVTLICTIAHKKEMRTKARNMFSPNYLEIYLKTDIETCVKRDIKNLYSNNLNIKNDYIAGVTEPYEEDRADLILDVRNLNSDSVFKITLKEIKNRLQKLI